MTNSSKLRRLAPKPVFTTSGDENSPTNQPAPAIPGPTITSPVGHVQSSSQRVMAIPELLSEIFSWISLEYVQYWVPASGTRPQLRKRYYTLSICGRVNRLWFEEAMRQLWANASKAPSFSLPQAMEKIEPQRRQIYANLIVSANLFNVDKKNIARLNSSLSGVTFPRLKRLNLILDVSRQTGCMPKLRAPVLDEVHLHLGIVKERDFIPGPWVTFDPREMYFKLGRREPFLRRGSARQIAGQMKKRLPSTKKLILNERMVVEDDTVKCFLDRMPGLVVERVESE